MTEQLPACAMTDSGPIDADAESDVADGAIEADVDSAGDREAGDAPDPDTGDATDAD